MIVLDTHALLWWRAGGDRLSRPAARAIDAAGSVALSPVTFWEVAMLVAKGRISLDRPLYDWAADLLGEPGVELAPFTPTAGIGAGDLPRAGFGGDPADAMIYATARELSVPLVSKDQRMAAHASAARDLKVLW